MMHSEWLVDIPENFNEWYLKVSRGLLMFIKRSKFTSMILKCSEIGYAQVAQSRF